MKKNEARKKSTAPVKSDGNGVEKSYAAWIAALKRRYRATQIKAAVAVNTALIEFYWNLGKDIAEKYPGEVYGSKFFGKLGVDLRRELPGASGFSKVNLIYCLKFYELYSAHMIVPQPVENICIPIRERVSPACRACRLEERGILPETAVRLCRILHSPSESLFHFLFRWRQ